MKKVTFWLLTLAMATGIVACTNTLTYFRHDESKGNVQCGGGTGLKRDSACNITADKPTAAQTQ